MAVGVDPFTKKDWYDIKAPSIFSVQNAEKTLVTRTQGTKVKSLNTSPGHKRFVFKKFSQRVEEIEIDVFRSLDTLKFEPGEGLSFFRESLLYWRELNTAEDFISFYEQMMPWVQTLPQILVRKETIISELLSRLKMQAKLSLEPILRLMAALSRDLLEEFLPFLPRITVSLVDLLKDGGERDPEILEQVFTSWSYIMMHLQKYLIRDVVLVLKITVHLRYYPKDYVQEFMAEAFSFLLRNAPVEQLNKGVRKIILEAVKKPSPMRKAGASALLWYTMRGTLARFHSRAEQVLRLLMDESIIGIGDKVTPGSDIVVDVVTGALQRICEELHPLELNLVWNCLFEEISFCISNGCFLRLSCLLSLLISTLRFCNDNKICDYQPMLELVRLLVKKVIIPSSSMKTDDYSCEVINRTMQFMLCLLDSARISNDPSTISGISLQWASVFEMRNPSLLTFVKGLLLKDPCVPYAFRGQIVSALSDLIEAQSEEVLYLMMTFFERLQGVLHCSDGLDGVFEVKISRLLSFFQETIRRWVGVINDIANGKDESSTVLHVSELAVLWGTVSCCPHIFGTQIEAGLSLLVELVEALNRLLINESESIAGLENLMWQSLVGTALASRQKLLVGTRTGLAETSDFLCLAKRYKSSSQVLHSVAEFLDSVFGDKSTGQIDASYILCHPELGIEKTVDAINIFSDNLGLPDKAIRISTLRILHHFEHPDSQLSTSDHHVEKKLKLEGSQTCEDSLSSNVIHLLLSIEETPLSISTSRKVINLISRIQEGLSAARISESYIPLLLDGIVGIFHNRFGHLWDPAMECLTVLIDKYVWLVWDKFVRHLEKLQKEFLISHDELGSSESECSSKSSALGERFKSFVTPDLNCTPSTKILTLLLKSIQRLPTVAESRSQQLIPLFFKFLGYNDDIASLSSFNWHACKGKQWKGVLKEWLDLLKVMRNPRSLYRSQVLRMVLLNRLLDEIDDIQEKVLECLFNWKDEYLLPYEQHLKNLTSSKNLGNELTTWTLSKESYHIQEGHRGHLIPIVIRLLAPKVRKPKMLASKKHAGSHHRRAVLCFLAQLDINELPLFFSLLLKPLQPISSISEGFDDRFWSLCKCSVDEFQAQEFVNSFTLDNIKNLSWKKRSGFLHVVDDILRTFDESRIRPFLNILMAFVVRILESCTLSLDSAKINERSLVRNHSTGDLTVHESVTENPITTNTAIKQFKDLRSLGLKIVSFVLNKYEHHDFDSHIWGIFFVSVKPLVDSFKQEGSSSEKASSLFSCFLAMSRSPALVSLLGREENLVPTVFSILTVRTASDAIINSVLIFIENLLNLDNDLVSEDDFAIKRVLVPHLDALILNLHDLFISHKGKQRKPGKTELRIFKLLPKYIKEPQSARLFLDIMLSFLAKRPLNSDECVESLHVIQGIMPFLGVETTGKILNAVNPLLISSGIDIRLSICNILDGLAINDPSLVFLAEVVRKLNAVSVSEMGELDYDTRVGAYGEITPELFSTLREDNALVILSHCVYDMSSEELILRQSASSSLLSFIHFASLVLDYEANEICEDIEIRDIRKFNRDNVNWTKTSIQRIINKFFLQHMGQAMSKEISIQKEWISLLRDIVLKLRGVPALNTFRPLCSEDAEVDFFNNILHIQKHRRARALSRFRNAICGGNLPEKIAMKVFVPLFFNMLIDVKDGKGEHVRDACMESLSAIFGCMQWQSYHAFLMRCFREMTLKPDKQKVLSRLICAILGRFHFFGSYSTQESKDSGSKAPNESTVLGHSCFAPGIPPEIQAHLQKTVLPQIQKLLTSDSERVNVTINLAALRLLKLLPFDSLESQLPSIIHRICNFLKNRLESIRDDARSALAACTKELGLEYLHFIVKVMKTTLKRGFEMHVLGYSLNFILSKTLSNHCNGKLDYCIEDLLSVAENDILGDVAEEKEVKKIALKMKETRKIKSFDTLKLIAQSITFKTNALKLLSPIKAHLQKHLTPKIKAKLETMLHHIAEGIQINSSVDQTDLFVFVFGLIQDGITQENLHGKDPSVIMANNKSNREVQSSHLITVFALGVLHNRLKNIKLDKKDEQLLSMLDPFVGVLGNCLSSKYEGIISTAGKCLVSLLRLPLPSLEAQADNIKTSLLDFAQKSGSPSSPLICSCLKLLTVLLQSTRISLSNDQLHMLIQFPLFVDLETNPSFIALSLLKAIVGRKLVVHEVYDVVTRVAELMVTSQIEPIRKKCSQILLQFLLDYRLSDKRLQQHLDFLLVNLSYEHPTGREAVLEMLHAIIVKFPKSVVDSQAQTFFLHLVARLANENDNKVHSMVGEAIKRLIRGTSQHALVPILEYSLSWYMGEKQHLWSAAAQVLSLLAEVLKKGFQTHISKILRVGQSIMTSALEIAKHKELDCSNEVAIPLWKEAYYSLVMLEKILLQFPELCSQKDLEEIWEAICKFLLYPHLWLRNISNQLVAFYFATVSEASRLDQEKLNLGTLLMMKPSRLFAISVSLCCQLKAQSIDDVAGNLITQNLVFAICGLHSFAKQRKFRDCHEVFSNLDPSENHHFHNSLELLGSRKGSSMLQSLTNSDVTGTAILKEQNEDDNSENFASFLVALLLKRMGRLALQMENIQMKVVFNCFRMISSQMGSEGCHDYAVDMLVSLYKVCDGFAGKVIADEVKQLAEEVRDSIRGILGVEKFVQVYNLIRKNLKAKRDKRRQEEKLIAAIDPVRDAKRKLRMAAKHKANKRRKIMTMKMWKR
ncbi:ARM repeat superfamily protein [Tasmannia lanceolata]|uniref:ARM repeat superfamily protein n=1 Tax=Tasmannia lanceolata TaxID=3420 RepID=UPI0040642C9A